MKAWFSLPPVQARKLQHQPRLLAHVRPPDTKASACVRTVKDKMTDTLWVARCVFNRYWPAPTRRDDRKTLESRSIDDTGEVTHPIVERKSVAVAVCQSTTARVVPQTPELAECIEPRPPSKTTPLVLEMREPRRRHDQRRSAAARRIGEPHAVSSLTETDVLLHSANSGRRVPVRVAQLGRD